MYHYIGVNWEACLPSRHIFQGLPARTHPRGGADPSGPAPGPGIFYFKSRIVGRGGPSGRGGQVLRSAGQLTPAERRDRAIVYDRALFLFCNPGASELAKSESTIAGGFWARSRLAAVVMV